MSRQACGGSLPGLQIQGLQIQGLQIQGLQIQGLQIQRLVSASFFGPSHCTQPTTARFAINPTTPG